MEDVTVKKKKKHLSPRPERALFVSCSTGTVETFN